LYHSNASSALKFDEKSSLIGGFNTIFFISWYILIFGSTSAIEPSVHLDLESGTIFRRTTDSRTCITAVLDNRRRHFCLVIGTKVQCELPFRLCALEILLLMY